MVSADEKYYIELLERFPAARFSNNLILISNAIWQASVYLAFVYLLVLLLLVCENLLEMRGLIHHFEFMRVK